MKDRSSVIAATCLLILSGAYLLASRAGVITVRAEGHAARGYFNKAEEGELPDIIAADREGYLRIPLPEDVTGDDLSVTGDPFKKVVYVRISGADEDFYRQNVFTGDMTGISDVRYGFSDGVSTVELLTEGISVPVSEYSNNSLFIKVEPPDKVYDRIIVIDSGHGSGNEGSVVYGIEERTITGNIARLLYEKLKKDGTMVCISTPDTSEYSEQERAKILNELGADLLISIHTNADPDTRVTNGISTEASPDMEEAAARLTTLLSGSLEQKDLGASVKKGSGITGYAEMPYISLKLGYITNKYEAGKMNSSDYQEKAAETIAGFIDTISE